MDQRNKAKVLTATVWVTFMVLLVLATLAKELEAEARGFEARCVDPESSSVPYPSTGVLGLTAAEAEEAKESFVVDRSGPGRGEVWVSNTDKKAAAKVSFLGEDGATRAKLFLRAGESSKVELAEGPYDAMFQAGRDWKGEAFGPCGESGKARGIVVVQAGAVSKVELGVSSRFVLANGIEPEAARASQAAYEARVHSRAEALETLSRARPSREAQGRDAGPI